MIVRETRREAWAAADDLIRHLDDDTIATASRSSPDGFGRSAADGGPARRRSRAAGDRAGPLGQGRTRPQGAGTALVGDPGRVAARNREYAEIGLDTFILSGYPHLEEAYRVAELLFPELGYARPADPAVNGGVAVADGRLSEVVAASIRRP